jgi:hypothetical protein
VAVDVGNGKTIHSYYSLSLASIKYARIPEIVRLDLRRCDVGAYRLSRLAVSVAIQGQGMGSLLLLASRPAAVCAWPRKRGDRSC